MLQFYSENYRKQYSPGSVELHQDILLTLGDKLLEVLGHGHLHVVSRVVRDGLWKKKWLDERNDRKVWRHYRT